MAVRVFATISALIAQTEEMVSDSAIQTGDKMTDKILIFGKDA